MPEGPEIRLAADQIAGAIVGKPLEKVFFSFADLKKYERRLRGEVVTAIDTRGKAMLTRFGNGLTMYSHNQLYGRWYVTSGVTPKTGRSLRVALHTADGCAFLYSASEVAVLDAEGVAAHPFLGRLGPDILDATPAQVRGVLRSRSYRGRALGGLYLDQGCLAGVGNYLRSEILFFAGLHYSLKPRDLDTRALGKLARVTCTIAQRSYKTRGVTNPAPLARRLKEQGKPYGKYRFAVFGRAGQPCHTCGGRIHKTSVSSRRLYFCPTCQPQPA